MQKIRPRNFLAMQITLHGIVETRTVKYSTFAHARLGVNIQKRIPIGFPLALPRPRANSSPGKHSFLSHNNRKHATQIGGQACLAK